MRNVLLTVIAFDALAVMVGGALLAGMAFTGREWSRVHRRALAMMGWLAGSSFAASMMVGLGMRVMGG